MVKFWVSFQEELVTFAELDVGYEIEKIQASHQIL